MTCRDDKAAAARRQLLPPEFLALLGLAEDRDADEGGGGDERVNASAGYAAAAAAQRAVQVRALRAWAAVRERQAPLDALRALVDGKEDFGTIKRRVWTREAAAKAVADRMRAEGIAAQLCACKVMVRQAADGRGLVVPSLCHLRVCAYCERGFGRQRGEELSELLQVRAAARPDARTRLVFATFTQRGDRREEPSEATDRLMSAWQKLNRTAWWRRTVLGAYWRREAHRSDAGYCHPHLHLIIELRPGVVRETRLVGDDPATAKVVLGWDDEARQRWSRITLDAARAAGLDHEAGACSVKLLAVEEWKEETGRIAIELTKYITKRGTRAADDFSVAELVDLADWILSEHGRQGCGYLGQWRRDRHEAERRLLVKLADGPAPPDPLEEVSPVQPVTGEVAELSGPVAGELAPSADAGWSEWWAHLCFCNWLRQVEKQRYQRAVELVTAWRTAGLVPARPPPDTTGPPLPTGDGGPEVATAGQG